MSVILVTGADGFISRRLVQWLNESGEHNVNVAPQPLAKTPPAGHVFQLVPDHDDEPATRAVLDYCVRHGATLTRVRATLPADPETLSADEARCAEHAESTGQPVNLVRPMALYGPGQPNDAPIPRLIAQIEAGSVVVQDLAETHDWLYIDDYVRALCATMQPGDGCRVFNIGSGRATPLAETIAIIQRIAGTNAKINEIGYPVGRSEQKKVDFTAARRELHWLPATSYSEGIRLTYASLENASKLKLATSRSTR